MEDAPNASDAPWSRRKVVGATGIFDDAEVISGFVLTNETQGEACSLRRDAWGRVGKIKGCFRRMHDVAFFAGWAACCSSPALLKAAGPVAAEGQGEPVPGCVNSPF